MGLTGVAGALVDVGFGLCLAALLVFLVIQFRRSGRGD